MVLVIGQTLAKFVERVINVGKFSYICRGCGQSLREGEHVVMRHVRSGSVLGEVVGNYDGYGSVGIEAELVNGFRSESGVNSDDELELSCGHLHDSVDNLGRMRVFNHPVNGKVDVDFFEHRELLRAAYLIKHGNTPDARTFTRSTEFMCAADDAFELLPHATTAASGVVAWHTTCLAGGQPGIEPSERARDQGVGAARPEFVE